jgi:hypothetical protein
LTGHARTVTTLVLVTYTGGTLGFAVAISVTLGPGAFPLLS